MNSTDGFDVGARHVDDWSRRPAAEWAVRNLEVALGVLRGMGDLGGEVVALAEDLTDGGDDLLGVGVVQRRSASSGTVERQGKISVNSRSRKVSARRIWDFAVTARSELPSVYSASSSIASSLLTVAAVALGTMVPARSMEPWSLISCGSGRRRSRR